MKVNKLEKIFINALINNEVKLNNKILECGVISDWFRKNRISGETLGFNSSWIEQQRRLRLKGLFLLKRMSDLLNKSDITYVIINYSHTIPYNLYDDVDVLIEHPLDLLATVEILSKEGFCFYDYFNRLYANTLALTAFYREDKEIGIDFYPEPSYGTFQFFDRFRISRRRIRRNIATEVSVIETFLPSPEDELIIMPTHAFSHGRFTINEIYHGFNLIKDKDCEIDWNYILDMTKRWAIGHILFLYMLFINDFAITFFKRKLIDDKLKTLQMQQRIECNLLLDWFLKQNERLISWPVKLSPWLLYKLAAFRAARLLKMGKDYKGEFIRHTLEQVATGLFGSRW
jgi:hypothetical protein